MWVRSVSQWQHFLQPPPPSFNTINARPFNLKSASPPLSSFAVMCCKHDLKLSYLFQQIPCPPSPSPPLLSLLILAWLLAYLFDFVGFTIIPNFCTKHRAAACFLNGSNNSTTCQLLQLNIAINMLQSLMRVLKLVLWCLRLRRLLLLVGFLAKVARMTNSWCLAKRER